MILQLNMSHPIGIISVSLFHDDGTISKSCKSDLVKQMYLLSSLYTILIDQNIIKDAMAVLQCNDMMKYKTLGDLAADYCI